LFRPFSWRGPRNQRVIEERLCHKAWRGFRNVRALEFRCRKTCFPQRLFVMKYFGRRGDGKARETFHCGVRIWRQPGFVPARRDEAGPQSAIINVLSLRHPDTQGLRHPLPTAILAVRGRRTHGAGPMEKGEKRPPTHHRIGMRRGQKGGQKAPIRVQFRQKSEKKSKKAPESALPILTFRPPTPLALAPGPIWPPKRAKIRQNPPKTARQHIGRIRHVGPGRSVGHASRHRSPRPAGRGSKRALPLRSPRRPRYHLVEGGVFG